MATFEFINEVPLETSIPHGDVPLESILCTEELRRRPRRSPDYKKENRALVVLATALADSDGKRPDLPRRLHPREPRGWLACSPVWPGTRTRTSAGNRKPRSIEGR